MFPQRFRLGIAVAGLAILFVTIAGPEARADTVFARMAYQLLDGLRKARADAIPAASGYGRPTIGARRFSENEVSVPAETANAWNRRLLNELQRLGRDEFNFVDEEGIALLVRDLEGSPGPADDSANRIAALKAWSRPDIRITGSVTMAGTTPVLAYQAMETGAGRLLASTSPRRMNFPETGGSPVVGANDVQAAIAPAAAQRGYLSTGAEVEILLRALGYDPGPVDGILTEETRRALRNYQLDSALPANGRMTRRVVENMRRDTR
ncbi:MAG: peptidoglycan-binding domain-containing protein [Alphaproteobacteria bacterium]